MGQAGTWNLVFCGQQDASMATVSLATIFDFPNLMSKSWFRAGMNGDGLGYQSVASLASLWTHYEDS